MGEALVGALGERRGRSGKEYRRSLPLALAFSATGTRPTAVLTGAQHRHGQPGQADLAIPAGRYRRHGPGLPMPCRSTLRRGAIRVHRRLVQHEPVASQADSHLARRSGV